MKSFFLLALSALSLPAFAQQTCYVDMVDRYSRVVATYTSWDDPRVCLEGMKQCRKAIRLQPHLGGVDCVRDQMQPVPGPRPGQPGGQGPRPGQPGGQGPRPGQPGGGHGPGQPYPGSQLVEVRSLIQDLASSVYSAQSRVKLTEKLILRLGGYVLSPYVNLCQTARTWEEQSQCLSRGVAQSPSELVREEQAISVVSEACSLANTWSEEKACYSASLKNMRFDIVRPYAQSCLQMYSDQASVECLKRAFTLR